MRRKRMRRVACWHIASVIAARYFGSYWGESGHWCILTRDGSLANDPQRTLASLSGWLLTHVHAQAWGDSVTGIDNNSVSNLYSGC